MDKKELKKIEQRKIDKENLEQALKDENWKYFTKYYKKALNL